MRSAIRREFVNAYLDSVPRFTARYLAIGLEVAPSLEQGFKLIERFGGEQSQIFRCTFAIENDRAIFAAEPQIELGLAMLPFVEGFISYIGRHLLSVTPLESSAIVASVTHEFAPDCSAPMPFPIRYAQDRISLDFPASWATRRSDRYDPGLWQVAEARCLAQEETVTLTNAIGSIQAQIVHLYDKSGRMPMIKELAEYRQQSPRTLMRYLKSQGMHYKTLTDGIQKRRAIELLESGQLSVEMVASTLGFSDSSSFRRSFRRWTGVNPSQWTKSASMAADVDAGDTGDLSSQPVSAEAAQDHRLA